jgi:hypothetical protein
MYLKTRYCLLLLLNLNLNLILNLFSPLHAQEGAPLTPAVKAAVIDSLRQKLERNYVYPDRALQLGRALKEKGQGGSYEGISDRGTFADRLTRDLRALVPDRHLQVRYDPGLESRIRAFEATGRKGSGDGERERRENYFFQKAEILKGNTGYLRFTNFADTGRLARKTVQAAFQFVAHSDALILDLRNNFGGSGTMLLEVLNYFFDRPLLASRSFDRIQNRWTEHWVGRRRSSPDGPYLSMPLYILTSERTFSAAEALAYHLKHLRNAVVIGDTTRGGAHTTRSFALGNGFVGFIPFTRGESSVTKTDWEGVGVLPDLPVPEEAALRTAQEAILKKKLAATADTTERRKLEWLLNDLRVQRASPSLPEQTLLPYTGAFEEFLFTLEEGALYVRNTHQRDKKEKLLYIDGQLFKIDEESQVEFIRDESGAVNRIRLLWNDGWVDTIKRTGR